MVKKLSMSMYQLQYVPSEMLRIGCGEGGECCPENQVSSLSGFRRFLP